MVTKPKVRAWGGKRKGMKYASSKCDRIFMSRKGARMGREVHKVLEHRINCKEGPCKCGIENLRLGPTKFNAYKKESEAVLRWIAGSDFVSVQAEARASYKGYGVRLDVLLESPLGHYVYLEVKRVYDACAKQASSLGKHLTPSAKAAQASRELEKHKEQVVVGALTWNKWLSSNPKAKGKPIRDGYVFYIASGTSVRVPESDWPAFAKKAEAFWNQKTKKIKE